MTKVMTIEEAAVLVEDGDVVALQNMATQAAPMAIVRELIRQEKRNLGLVCLVGGMPVDWLAAAGVIDRFIGAAVSMEQYGLCQQYRKAVEDGRDPRRGALRDGAQRPARSRRPQPALPPDPRPDRDRPDSPAISLPTSHSGQRATSVHTFQTSAGSASNVASHSNRNIFRLSEARSHQKLSACGLQQHMFAYSIRP